MANAGPAIPRDGRLISLILASIGVEDADERVIHQLLDFVHRYSSDVLLSAQSLADHASRPGPSKIEKEDVELAIQMRRRYEFFEAPPRDYLASLAHELNSQPLPILPESFDVVRLPPPHQRLAQVNFELVPNTTMDEFSDDSEEEESEDEPGSPDAEGKAQDDGDADADADADEDMEEVTIEPQDRDIDEDYDT